MSFERCRARIALLSFSASDNTGRWTCGPMATESPSLTMSTTERRREEAPMGAKPTVFVDLPGLLKTGEDRGSSEPVPGWVQCLQVQVRCRCVRPVPDPCRAMTWQSVTLQTYSSSSSSWLSLTPLILRPDSGLPHNLIVFLLFSPLLFNLPRILVTLLLRTIP